MRWPLLFVGLLGILYILGSVIVGKFGFAVVLSYPTAWAIGMSRSAAELLWTAIYIMAILIILILAFILPEENK